MMIRLRSRLALSVFLSLGLAGSGLLLHAQLTQPTGTWVPAGIADGRSNAAVVVLGDGRTLIAGGRLADGTPTESVVIYDPTSGSTSSAGQLLIPRVGAAAAQLNPATVVITGGRMGEALTADVEVLSLATGTSSLVGAMAEPRADHAMARLPNGRVLIVGGATVGGAALGTAEVFDPANNSVTPAGSLTTARIGASATTLIDGRVLIAGGRTATPELRTAEIYDPVAPSPFTPVPTLMSVGRAGHTAVLLPHNAGVLIAGGTSSGSPVASSDLFLPAIFPDPFSYGVGSFAVTGSMNAPRANAFAGPAGDGGYAFVSGGGGTARELYRYATIKTDKDDYAPGERAIITGSGWRPNEEVHLLFQEDPAIHEDYELTVVADGVGNIRWDRWSPEQHDLGVRFYLMATGSTSRAQTTFTDSQPQQVNVAAPLSASVTAGAAATATYGTVTVTVGGNADPCTVTLGVGAKPSTNDTGLPASVTPNFGNGSPTTTVSFTSSFSASTTAATPAGTYTFRVTASRGANCQGNGIEYSQQQLTLIVSEPVNVNDEPSFTASNQIVNEDAGAVSLAGWAQFNPGAPDESGQTATYTVSNVTNSTLFSVQPAVAPNGTLTFTPAANANGSSTISVFVRDSGGTANGGDDTSPTLTFTITVNAVNDQPSFTTTGNPAAVNEDSGAQTVNSWASFQAGGGTDENSHTAMYVVTNVGNPSLFSGVGPTVSSSGTLTYTPAPNAFGTSTFDVYVQDSGGTANGGVDTSATQTFTIIVNGVNDAPSFTSGGNVTVNEDSGAYTNAWASNISAGPNESGQVLTFNVSNNNNALFSVLPAIAANGTLTFTPAANAFGAATVTVTLSDDGGTANGGSDTSAPPVTFTITVNSVNDAPSFTSGGNVTVLEDSAAYNAGWATLISAGPPNESGQTLTFNITNNTDSSLFSVQPAIAANGVLTFTPAANAFGAATITVTLSDNGGTAYDGVDTSAAQTFTITVTGVNDAPSFASGGNVTGSEDTAYSAAWATAISAGPNESGQVLTFNITNNTNPALFSVLPGIAANGTLTFTPAANAFGTATITVTLSDNGGTANGGVDTSAPVTFTITVSPVNDAPTNLVFNGIAASLTEGDSMAVGGRFSDVEADAHTVTINWGDNSAPTTITLAAGVTGFAATHTYADDNPTATASDLNTIQVLVTDNGVSGIPPVSDPKSVSGTAGTLTVNNVTPTLAITAPADGALYPVGALVTVTAPITDPGADTFTCSINWDDPASPAVETSSSTTKNCDKTHTFAQAGVYSIVITVNDDDQPGVTDTKTVMVIVYDPSAGFVTGGGTIWSPAGAYMANTTLEGKANFGFVSKYLRGAKTPSGQTEFQFKAGDLNFHGDVYQWLVVSGAKAQYKGTGTLNGVPGYGFLLTATDGQLVGGNTPDRFRIKIVDPNGTTVVYDNVPTSLSDDIDASGQQNIQTGSIVIHTGK